LRSKAGHASPPPPAPRVATRACSEAVLMMCGSTGINSLPPDIARTWIVQVVSNRYIATKASATVAPSVSKP
jgi:hypothetical protein